jgi:hypothetical protein
MNTCPERHGAQRQRAAFPGSADPQSPKPRGYANVQEMS